MKSIYYPIAQHLQQFCKPGEVVIWRDAFRWKQYAPNSEHGDVVLSNHYDSMSLEQLAQDFGYDVDWDTNMNHVGIVRKLI